VKILIGFLYTSLSKSLTFLEKLIGIFRQPLSIYNAVWIDKFGFDNYKTLMK